MQKNAINLQRQHNIWRFCEIAFFFCFLASTAKAQVNFARDVRPIFQKHCYECHGPDKQKSGYRLDVRDVALKGGDNGEAAIVPKDAAKSPLYRFVSGEDEESMMPPKDSGKPRLTTDEQTKIKAWLDEGAVWPDEYFGQKRQVSSHWSLQPLSMPRVPNGTGKAIDGFVREKLVEKKLTPAAEADRQTLIRRLSFDLIGLPPSPAEIDAFVSDDSPEAYQTLVDRLLASSHYGERWGRHWLDIARYTESQGFEYDRLRDNAWHYRDYVIKSFNDDKPYTEFMKEQIAGDVMEPMTRDGIVATSLLVCGPWDQAGNSQKNATQRAITREDELEDMIGVVGQSFLGLTVNCARCHAHKFDPIPHEEYYRIKSVFEGVKHGERTIATDEESKSRNLLQKEFEIEIDRASKTMVLIESEASKQAIAKRPTGLPEPGSVPFTATKAEVMASLTPEQSAKHSAALADMQRAQRSLSELKKLPVSYTGVRVQPPITKRLRRGDVNSPDEDVTPGALSAVFELEPDFGLAADSPEGERRLKFADWLSDTRNPLPARVMANRVWHLHFGQGLVATPNDFGVSGERPSHPELLDWLAVKFIESGWSVKSLHRLIVHSATYRQASEFNDSAASIDADNRLLWRFAPRRLEAEAVRDAMLVASGQLNPIGGGPSFRPFTTTEFNATFYTPVDRDEPEFNRRTVYRINVHSGKDPLLDSFDCPDPSVKTPRRGVTTTPLQSLELMNNAFVQRQASHLAERALQTANDDVSSAIETSYRMALGRAPNGDELIRAIAVVKERGLASVCWALFNSTEFIYVR